MSGPASRVIELEQGDPRWEAFVRAHPQGLIYHHPAWVEVLRREYAQRFTTLACLDEAGDLRGLLSLCETRGLPLGLGGARGAPRLSSLPRTPVGGPLALDSAAAETLVEAALGLARSNPAVLLELKPTAAFAEGTADELEPVEWNRTYVLELPAEGGPLRFGSSRSHGAIKRAVQKASRSRVTAREAEDEAELRAWYHLYLETMRTHLHPPRPYSFFRAMWDVLRPRGLMRLLLAEQSRTEGQRLLAGSIFFTFGQTYVYGFNGRLERELAVRPNDLLHWEAIHDAAASGYRFYDLGEVGDTQEGLARFKAKWGATPTRLRRFYYPGQRAPREGSEATGRAVRVAERVWARLPLAVTAQIGRQLYRYL